MSSRLCAFVFAAVALAGPVAAAERALPTTGTVRIEVPPPGRHQEVRLRDGSRLLGRIVRVEAGGHEIVFLTIAGAEIVIPRSEIAYLDRLDGEVEVTSRPRDAAGTRLMFGPTGRSLRRGEGYVGVYQVVLPFVQVGVTDRLSIGGGTPVLFFSEASHPIWITPKLQLVSTDRLQAAVGVMHIFNVGDASPGIAYGVATYGSSDRAVTAGVGYSYSGNDGALVVMAGGERRLGRRTALITENYWLGGGWGLVSVGLRRTGDRVSGDVGLVVPIGGGSAAAFPLVNLVFGF